MNGSGSIGYQEARHGRHRKAANGEAWIPDVATRSRDKLVPIQRAYELDNSIIDTDVFPNLRPGKHDATAFASAIPCAVLAPVEYVDAPGAAPRAPEYGDADPLGLRKFNLGSVPASVTPPKTWRKAAWFSITSSAAALAALVTISSAFMNTSTGRTTIDALPGLPSAVLPTAPAPQAAQHTTRDPAASSSDTATKVDTNGDGIPDAIVAAPGTGTGQGQGDSSVGWPSSRGGTSPSTGGPTTGSSGDETAQLPPPQMPASVYYVPANPFSPYTGNVPADPHSANTASVRYYEEVAEDPEAATADTEMTSGARQRVIRRYAKVKYVRVSSRVVDGDQATTVNTITLYNKDGTVDHVTRTLYFTRGTHPQITRESA